MVAPLWHLYLHVEEDFGHPMLSSFRGVGELNPSWKLLGGRLSFQGQLPSPVSALPRVPATLQGVLLCLWSSPEATPCDWSEHVLWELGGQRPLAFMDFFPVVSSAVYKECALLPVSSVFS